MEEIMEPFSSAGSYSSTTLLCPLTSTLLQHKVEATQTNNTASMKFKHELAMYKYSPQLYIDQDSPQEEEVISD